MLRLAVFLPVLMVSILLDACNGGSAGAPITQPIPSAFASPADSASCLAHTCVYITGKILRKGRYGMPQGRGRILDVYQTRANGTHVQVQAIRGKGTDLGFSGVAVDAGRNIYVAGGSRIDVYAAGSNGDAPPFRTIRGPKTGLYVQGIAVDAAGGIYVANRTSSSASITVYAAGSKGDAKPSRTISGPSTGLDDPNGVAVDARNDIYVLNGAGSITVYAAGANGNAAPIQTIAGSKTVLSAPPSYDVQPQGIAVDESNAIYTTVTCAGRCPDAGTNGVAEILTFAPGSDGNVAPIRTIYGYRTDLGPFGHIALDAGANIYFAYGQAPDNGGCATITVVAFAAGANGNAAPALAFNTRRCDFGGFAVR